MPCLIIESEHVPCLIIESEHVPCLIIESHQHQYSLLMENDALLIIERYPLGHCHNTKLPLYSQFCLRLPSKLLYRDLVLSESTYTKNATIKLIYINRESGCRLIRHNWGGQETGVGAYEMACRHIVY